MAASLTPGSLTLTWGYSLPGLRPFEASFPAGRNHKLQSLNFNYFISLGLSRRNQEVSFQDLTAWI